VGRFHNIAFIPFSGNMAPGQLRPSLDRQRCIYAVSTFFLFGGIKTSLLMFRRTTHDLRYDRRIIVAAYALSKKSRRFLFFSS
jgi:hypothetical protein